MRSEQLGRTWKASILLVAVALLAGACGDSTSTTSTAGDDESTTLGSDDRSVELTFMNWYYGPGDEESYDAIITNYMADDPRVTDVIIEVQPFERYHDVLNVKMAGDNPPDIAWINSSFARAYVESGRLLDLRPILEEIPGWDLDDFTPASLGAWSIGDELYALPFTNATNVVFYNVAAFEEAGIPNPDEMVASGAWTWENLKDAAKQLVDSGASRFGFLLQNDIYVNGWDQLVEVWEPYGGGPWTEDGKTCTFDSAETVAATQLVHDMIFIDESHPGPGVDVLFNTGDVGMALTRPDLNLDELSFEWGVVSQPDGPEGYVPSVAQNGFAVFDSPNADIAAQLLASMLSKENMVDYPVFPPGNRQSLHTPELLATSIPGYTTEQVEGTVVKAFQSENQVPEYTHPNWAPIWSTAQQIFDGEMWVPGADVEAVLSNVCDSIEDLLG